MRLAEPRSPLRRVRHGLPRLGNRLGDLHSPLPHAGDRLPRLGNRLRRVATRRALIGLAALVFGAIGLFGAASYWESYYQHRGFTPPARIPHAGVGRLETVQFYSRALRRRAQYLVYLPPGYSAARRYPVLYLLHGSPGRPQLFFDVGNVGVRLDNLVAEHAIPPMILVAPDGRIGGSQFSDSEWANTRSGRFDSYIVETVHDVDSRFVTIANRQGRAIAGYSEGGYGALNIALHHLGVFGSVQVWSGYYDQPHPAGPFKGASPATLAYNSPQDFVARVTRRLKRMGLSVFIYGGHSDPASILIKPMVRLLRADGASAKYAIYRGGHDWQLWNAHLDRMLMLAGEDVSGRATLAPQFAVRPDVRLGAARLSRTPPSHRAARAGRVAAQRAGRGRRVASRRVAPPPSLAAPRVVPVPSLAAPRVAPVPTHRASRIGGRAGTDIGELLAGLLLALISAAAINLGFLLQHRGLSTARSLPGGSWALAGAMVRNRSWLGGQALGWAGFAAQIMAVTIAPLSLVQSFAAGGLALSVPLAARLFGHEISRRQRVAVLLVALGLAVLPLGLAVHGDHLVGGRLTITSGVVLAAAVAVGAMGTAPMRAIASGLFYGVADAAIKAVSVHWGADGAGALLSGWTVLAVVGTFAGFVSFQAALKAGSAVTTISLMNCLAALVALVAGVVAFGESLGAGPAVSCLHFLAIALVLACVPVLAAAQAELAASVQLGGPPKEPDRVRPGEPAPHIRADGTAPQIWPSEAVLEASQSRTGGLGLLFGGPSGEERADGEESGLHPRPGPGAAGEERVPEAHVSRS